MILSINSDNLVTASGVQDYVTGSYINSATVTGVLLTAARAAVAGSAFTLAYVAASDGVYQGYLPVAVTALLTQGANYVIEITASAGGKQTVMDRQLPANYYRGG